MDKDFKNKKIADDYLKHLEIDRGFIFMSIYNKYRNIVPPSDEEKIDQESLRETKRIPE